MIEEQLATQVGAHNETRFDPGLFSVLVELHPGVDPEQVEAVVREEMQRIVDDGVTASELKRARIQIRSAFLFDEETVLEAAVRLGRYEVLSQKGWRLLDDVLSTYDVVDRRAVRETAARLFAPENWTVVWSVPTDQEIRRPTVKKRRRGSARPRGTEAAS